MKEKELRKEIERFLLEHFQVKTKEEFFNEEESNDDIWNAIVEESIVLFQTELSASQKLQMCIISTIYGDN